MRLLFWTMFAVLSAATLVTSVPATAEPPTAPLNFCNRTSEEVDVAVGYYSSGIHDEQSSNVLTGPFVTRGWWGVKRCCPERHFGEIGRPHVHKSS